MPYIALLQILRTQWQRIVGPRKAVHTGLNYAAVPGPAKALGLDLDNPSTWSFIQRAESAALEILNSR